MANTPLDEFEAAVLIGMSPRLLQYFASYKVKKNDDRKLAVAKKSGDTLYFDRDELKDYDDWLRQPWQAAPGKRPNLPTPIRDEIREEANLECALCKASGQAGEAAHIRDVATSKNNHPHNLIWLCSNHHTKLDNGSFGPKGANNSDIVALKQGLQFFKKHAWLGQAQISKQIAAIFSLCSDMHKRLMTSQSPIAIKAAEDFANQALALLPKLASHSDAEEVQVTLDKLTVKIASDNAKPGITTAQRLVAAVSFEEEFLENSGLIRCPLCRGSKVHNGYDCPVCNADGAIPDDMHVELEEFKLIRCQLCEGTGRHDGNDCPVCHGERELERRFSDRIDFGAYKTVDCPLCKGRRYWMGDECRACRGEGNMPQGVADQVDVRDFDFVDCPLCKGKGFYNGDDCLACGGERTMQAQHAADVDLSEYKLCKCQLCSGTSYYFSEDCPACGGEGQMTKGQAEYTDFGSYAMVDCPRCNGRGKFRGEECTACRGDRQMQRRHAENLDRY